MPTKVAGDYVETIGPRGYVNNREITNLPGVFLVKGSQNTRIVNGEKVVSSKRYTLKGAAKDVNKPIVTSFDWKTNTSVSGSSVYRNIRGYNSGGELEVWFDDTWERIKNGYVDVNFEWTTWWDTSELLDMLLGVRGDDGIYMWSGGIAEIASVTADTLIKKGHYTPTLFDVEFKENTPDADTITDLGSGFLTAGFAAGDRIVVTGTTSNNATYTIDTVVAGKITLISDDDLTAESPSNNAIVIRWENNGTWAEARFLLATSGRAVLIGGVKYTYTGGEGTGTLTGLSVSPVTNGVSSGDRVMQDILVSNPSDLNDIALDRIGVLNNHIYVGSTTSREVWISKNSDYTNYSFTSPLRVPGEGFKLTLDDALVAIVPDEDDMYLSAGDDEWYKVTLEFTADQGGESVVIRKLKTAPGQGAVAQSAVGRVKNNVAFLSVERTLDTLGNVENILTKQNTSVSDDIKDDIESYDITDAHVLYFRRSIFIAIPNEGLVLEYDMRFGYWQPPQLFPVRRLAIIDNALCGHSNNSNETYKLYDGFNDNGAPFKAVAAFGFENFGTRFGLKNFDEIATEGYISKNTVLTNRVVLDFKGATKILEFKIDGSDSAILFSGDDFAGLGKEKLGSNQLGSVLEEISDLSKFRAIDTTGPLDFFERQRIFESESPDCRFEIIAYGENTKDSDNEPVFIRR